MTDADAAPGSVGVVVVAAGSGSRLGADVPKAFVLLRGRPLLAYAVDTVARLARLRSLVVVAPARGSVSPAGVAEGASLPAGSRLATIAGRRETVEVAAGYAGVLAEWLVAEGDLVDAGDPIARLYPEVSA